MVELTPSDLSDDDDAGDAPQETDVGQFMQRVAQQFRENPQLQQVAAQVAQQNGVDLSPVLSALNGEAAESPQAAPQTDGGQQPAQSPSAGGNATAGDSAPLSADDVMGFMQEIADLHPKGWEVTLSDLHAIGQQNPEVIETALSDRLSDDEQ